jgi:hypothetical protein
LYSAKTRRVAALKKWAHYALNKVKLPMANGMDAYKITAIQTG